LLAWSEDDLSESCEYRTNDLGGVQKSSFIMQLLIIGITVLGMTEGIY